MFPFERSYNVKFFFFIGRDNCKSPTQKIYRLEAFSHICYCEIDTFQGTLSKFVGSLRVVLNDVCINIHN